MEVRMGKMLGFAEVMGAHNGEDTFTHILADQGYYCPSSGFCAFQHGCADKLDIAQQDPGDGRTSGLRSQLPRSRQPQEHKMEKRRAASKEFWMCLRL